MNLVSYSMNVHPGEDLLSVRRAVERVALPLRSALEAGGLAGPEAPFALGLRLGAEAAKALRNPETMRSFALFLERNKLPVLGINGFPYGAFGGDGAPVKTRVYEPDWADPRRLAYTCNLFYALTHFAAPRTALPIPLSVSTVPLGYHRGEPPSEAMVETLCSVALFLRKLEGFTGKRFCLALEPEPDCLLESAQDTVDFFERLWRHPSWNPLCRDFIGVCFDTCHFAVNYETPLDALRYLVAANIPVARVQVSAALEFTQFATAEELAAFNDGIFLHQTRRREEDASLTCFPDLSPDIFPELLGRRGRIHCHVPLSWEGNGHIGSTRHMLTPAFWRYVRSGGWPLEVEVYTYSVLPGELRTRTLSEMLLRDMRWVVEQLRKA